MTGHKDALRDDEIYARALDRVYLLALAAVAARNGRSDDAAELRARAGAAPSHGGRLADLARRLSLATDEIDFLAAASAFSADHRLASPAVALAANGARHGLSVAVAAEVLALEPAPARHLAAALDSSDHQLHAHGLIVSSEPDATAMLRPHSVPGRVVEFLQGSTTVFPDFSLLTRVAAIYDDAQEVALAAVTTALTHAPTDLLCVVEGATGSGRRGAIAAAITRAVVLDAPAIDPRKIDDVLLALRREALLHDAVPVIADVDALFIDDPARARFARAIERWRTPVIVTTTVPGLDLRVRRPTVRVRWPTPDAITRARLWSRAAAVDGDVTALAHRYRVGPGAIALAVGSTRTLAPPPLTAVALERGLRHNVAEKMGTLARRVDVTTTWDDLVVAEDTADQLRALIARVRHAPMVLDRWGFGRKLARGGGVAALLSGPPGTGKTMCAGLLALELDLELYQVDLSQIVSKWIGETEKQLSRVFDAAEEGHGLLLFDEADALFGQRSSDLKGATDRYANLEVNFLLQRIEAFSGIAILTTNLETAIDPAFKRRLAAHLVFDLPDEDERALLWRRYVETGAAPVARDADFDELARAFPKMSGANIRNAAVAAAFLAADSEAPSINQEILHRAARIEYRAMGHMLAERAARGGTRLA